MVEWGFPTGGVREIASNREDASRLQGAFWKIIYAKIVLIIPAILILIALVTISDPEIRQVVFLSGLSTILGAAFACEWFALGVEKLGRFIFVSVSARIFVTILTFVLVRNEADADLAALLHGLNGLFGGLPGFLMIVIAFRYIPKRESLAEIRRCITSNFSLFLARANGILYVSAPPLILGLVANPTQVGIYSGADKIARICVMLIGPIGIVVTPRIFSSMQTSKELAAMLSGRYLVIQAAITIPMSLVLFIFAPQIVFLILGDGYGQSSVILRILAPVPLLVGLSNSLGNQFLIPLALDRSLAVLSLVCSLAYVLILTAMTIKLAAIGASVALVLVELFMIGGAVFIVLRGNREYVRDAWLGIRTFNPLELIRTR
jgi:O-antigen/teichoic acid export membrane protein